MIKLICCTLTPHFDVAMEGRTEFIGLISCGFRGGFRVFMNDNVHNFTGPTNILLIARLYRVATVIFLLIKFVLLTFECLRYLYSFSALVGGGGVRNLTNDFVSDHFEQWNVKWWMPYCGDFGTAHMHGGSQVFFGSCTLSTQLPLPGLATKYKRSKGAWVAWKIPDNMYAIVYILTPATHYTAEALCTRTSKAKRWNVLEISDNLMVLVKSTYTYRSHVLIGNFSLERMFENQKIG